MTFKMNVCHISIDINNIYIIPMSLSSVPSLLKMIDDLIY